MDKKHVEGEKRADIFIYALSTCVWCKKTKKLLQELGVEYDYIDVDQLDDKERGDAVKQMSEYNPSGSFPTVIINKKCIVGFDEDKIKEALQ